MVHNGIEYGDMQLISEAYDILKTVGGLSNEELEAVFTEWNKSELESFLIEITASIFKKKDDKGSGYLVDKVLDKTGMKVRFFFRFWYRCFFFQELFLLSGRAYNCYLLRYCYYKMRQKIFLSHFS